MTAAGPVVYLVDDDNSVRKALTRLISSAGYQVKAFDSARAFLEMQEECAGEACLVLDVQMPEVSGLELQNKLNAADALLPIVFITGHGDIPMSVRAMKAGAADFLAKPVQDAALLRAISAAITRSARPRAERQEREAVQVRAARLTARERQVMALVVAGMRNKDIAEQLGTVEKTIKVHRASVMEKMEADSLASLVRLAEKAGISPHPER